MMEWLQIRVRSGSPQLRVFSIGFWILSIAFALAGFSSVLAETPQPVQWTLSASCRDCPPTGKGATVVAHLNATIESGWHVYALDQGPGGPDPMRISLPQQAFVMDGDIGSPRPKTAFDPNFGIEVRYYENEAAFTLQLKKSSENSSEPLKVFVDVSYQACTREMCMAPKVAHLAAEVSK
jgi:DsbC/DsbD-like thiol-disulfide interchange protein